VPPGPPVQRSVQPASLGAGTPWSPKVFPRPARADAPGRDGLFDCLGWPPGESGLLLGTEINTFGCPPRAPEGPLTCPPSHGRMEQRLRRKGWRCMDPALAGALMPNIARCAGAFPAADWRAFGWSIAAAAGVGGVSRAFSGRFATAPALADAAGLLIGRRLSVRTKSDNRPSPDFSFPFGELLASGLDGGASSLPVAFASGSKGPGRDPGVGPFPGFVPQTVVGHFP